MLHLPEAFLPPFLEVLMPPSKGDTCPDTPSSRSQQHYSATSIAVDTQINPTDLSVS